MAYYISAVIGYLFGCINIAYFFGRKQGFDIRTKGSKNAGATNIVITMGWWKGILVAAVDISKAVAAIWLTRALFSDVKDISEVTDAVTGAACITGHIFPFYMKFKGGKGYAAFFGTILMLSWKYFFVMLAVVILLTYITDQILIGTLTTVAIYPFYLILTTKEWLVAGIMIYVAIVIIYKHYDNIRSIINGDVISFRNTIKQGK